MTTRDRNLLGTYLTVVAPRREEEFSVKRQVERDERRRERRRKMLRTRSEEKLAVLAQV